MAQTYRTIPLPPRLKCEDENPASGLIVPPLHLSREPGKSVGFTAVSVHFPKGSRFAPRLLIHVTTT